MSSESFTAPRFHARTWYQDRLGEAPRPEPAAPAGSARIAIVGAGLAGLSTALECCRRDGDGDGVVVLDRGEAGEGASGRNGGFVFAGYSREPDALARRVGMDRARRLHRWTRDAVGRVRAHCHELGVAISAEPVLLADWFGEDDRLDAMRRRMRDRFGFRLEWLDRAAMRRRLRTDRYGCGLAEPGSFHFNPLEYTRAMANAVEHAGGRVRARCPVTRLRRAAGRWHLATPRGDLVAGRVVLATGGYDRTLSPRARRCLQPIATYIVVTEPLGARLDACMPSDHAVYDTRFAFDYYRRLAGGRLLWGGRISTADRTPAAVRKLMRRDLRRVFPSLADCRLDYAWGGWMSYARHQMPVLAEIGPGLWLAAGFGGHGMAPTALAGRLLADALAGDDDRLRAFDGFGPAWAGGAAGRPAIQAIYWWKQLRDRLR